MTDVHAAIQAWVRAATAARAVTVEGLLYEAIRLQDFDRLDRLTVVEQDGCSPAVASLLL